MKNKRFFYRFLACVLSFCLICSVPIVSGAETSYTLFDGSYGYITDGNLYKFNDDQYGKYWGNIDTSHLGWSTTESYADLATANVDANNMPMVSFTVRAPQDGTYSICPFYNTNGITNNKADYYMAIVVNDNSVYKHHVEEYIDVTLKAGLNIIRCIPFVKDTWTNNGGYLNIKGIYVQDNLTVLTPNPLTCNAGDSSYAYRYSTKTAGGGLSNTQGPLDYSITIEQLNGQNIHTVPSFSYTFTAPENGYYDMFVKYGSGLNGVGYMGVLVDGVVTTKRIRPYGASEGVLSVYMTAGTHNVSVTGILKSALGGDNNQYTNFTSLRIFGGATLAANQMGPMYSSYDGSYGYISDGNLYKFNDDQYGKYWGNIDTSHLGWSTTESYADLATANVDANNMPMVSFTVRAPQDGTYSICPFYNTNGITNNKADYYMAVVVNDNSVYKHHVEEYIDVTLKAGLNIIRCIPFVKDTWTNNGGYLNIKGINVQNNLTVLTPDSLKCYAGDSPYVYRYNTKTVNSNISNTQGPVDYSIKIEDLDWTNINTVPSFSYTFDAPENGYYDMFVRYGSGLNGVGYMGVLVDGEVTTKRIRPFSTTEGAFSVYMTKGTHTVTVTGVLKSELGGDNNQYTNITSLRIFGGAALAATQLDPTDGYNSYSVNDAAYINNYKRQYTTDTNAGFPGSYCPDMIAGGAWNLTYKSFDSLSEKLERDKTPFIAFAVNAPEAGSYYVRVRYRLGFSGNDDSLLASYIAENGSAYIPVIVNNGDLYKATYTNHASWFYTSKLSVELNEGLNIIYFASPVKEFNDVCSGAYLDYGAFGFEKSLTLADNVTLQGLGDVNQDGCFDISDLVRLKKFSVDDTVSIDFSESDFNFDNKCDALDLTEIKRSLLGVGQNGNWLVARPTDGDGLNVTVTAPSKGEWLSSQNTASVVATSNASSGSKTITVNPSSTKQTIDGFGACMTDSSAQNLALLTNGQLQDVMNDLFGKTNGDGLGLSMMRLPIGASDFADPLYTFDDMPEGETDMDLEYFNIDHDLYPVYSTNMKDGNTQNDISIIDLIKMAQTIAANNGNDMKYIATPWTAPLWMKTNYDWNTLDGSGNSLKNTLKSSCYDVYAEYLIKFLKAYSDEGIDIDYLSVQNEPDGLHGITSMYMTPTYVNNFIKNNLFSKLQSYNSTNSKNVGLLGYDFSWAHSNYSEYLSNDMMDYLAGGAFHAYADDHNPRYQAAFAAAHPDKKVYVTEGAGNKDTYVNFFVNTNRTTSALRSSANGYCYFNIMLDENLGPADSVDGIGNNNGIALLGFNRNANTYYKTEDYYALAQYSKFIRPGAVIVDSTATSTDQNLEILNGINNVVARNTDGSYAAVINNNEFTSQKVAIDTGLGYTIEYIIPARATVTITWDPSTIASYAG